MVKILVTAVCSKVKNLSLILQPGLSRTETALILLMTIPLRLHAAFSQSGLGLWLGSMLCLHLTAFRLIPCLHQSEDAAEVHPANG